MSSVVLCCRAFNKINFEYASLHRSKSKQFLRYVFPFSSHEAVIQNLQHKKSFKYRYFSNEAPKRKQDEASDDRMSFQQMLSFRKEQAQRSVLVEVLDKDVVSSAASACEKLGGIKNAFAYDGHSENVFLLLEFAEESSMKKLLSECQNENVMNTLPISSRVLNFKEKFPRDSSKLSIDINYNCVSTTLQKSKPTHVSDVIENFYFSEKLSELSIRIRFFFCELIRDAISGLFPHCEVIPFGSSVNGIGKQGCDLDVMMRLHPLIIEENSEFSFLNKTCLGKVQDLQRRSVHGFGSYFRTFLPGLSSVKEVLNARVPIIKLDHKILKLDCDISFNQMSAVLMSEMLYFCGEVDCRVRPLIYAVKKWAKDTDVTYEYPGSWITNFGLSLLVIFFLQNRPSPILPCFNDAMKVVGYEDSADFKIEYLMPLSDFQSKASLNEESLGDLLKEFLAYLGSNPFKDRHISVLDGLAIETNTISPILVQYPLEEDKNVTKNVCQAELDEMCRKAQLSYEYLSDCLKSTELPSVELSSILGSSVIVNKFQHKSTRS